MNGKQLKSSILQWAIQGKLVPQNPKDEPASKLLERIAAQRVIASGAKQSKKNPASRLPAGRQCIYRDGSSWFEESKDTQGLPAGRRDITEEIPFDIPESWEWCRLDILTSLITKGSSPSWQGVKYVDDGILFITSENVGSGCLLLSSPKYLEPKFNKVQERSVLKKGDILTNIVGASIGRTAIYNLEKLDSNINQAVALIRLVDLSISDYIVFLFNSAFLVEQMIGKTVETARANISLTSVSNLLIPFPPFAEQKRIVKKLEQILPLVDEYDQAQNQLDKLNKELPEALKKSILQQAIQGKLVPPACRLAGRTQNLPGFEKGKWYTYVIECEDGSFYKGHTSNLSNRFKEHCAGKGADWTASHKPKQVYYYEVHYGEEEAISREKYLKSGAGREWFQKEVVNSPENWEPAQKLLERIIASRNGCSTNQGVILSEAQSAKSKNPAKKKSKNETSRIYRDTDGLWYEQTGTSEPVNISEEIPFEIPETWTWCRLQSIVSKLVDGDHNPPAGMSNKTKYLMLSSRNINDDKLVDLDKVRYLTEDLFTKENERTNAQKGDILFTSVGTIGRSCILSDELHVCFQRSVTIMTTDIYNEYLKRVFDSPFYQSYAKEHAIGTAQLGFYLKEMAQSLIPLPPLAEQKRIVAKLEQLFKVL